MIRILSLLLFSLSLTSLASVCPSWELQDYFSEVDSDIVFESSGISSSIDFPGQRFYHINDSGSGASFHTSFLGPVQSDIGKDKNNDGLRDIESVMLRGASAQDLEAIDVGPCLEKNEEGIIEGCIYLGDIGDNDFKRNNLKIFIVAEKKSYKSLVKSKLQLNFSYEDGRHNAEAMMVHPNGDIFIFTKNTDPDGKSRTAKSLSPAVYKISRRDYENGVKEIDVVFKKIRSIDIESIVTFGKKKEYLVTDSSFSPDGKRFVLLTLGGIIELDTEILYSAKAIDESDYKIIESAPVLSQQEAITYSRDGKSLIYTSEKKNKKELELNTEMLRLNCSI